MSRPTLWWNVRCFSVWSVGSKTSVTAGRFFHRTHTPWENGFWAIFLVGFDKRGCSAKRLEKMIGVHYATAWLMIHKIRKAWGIVSPVPTVRCDWNDDSYFGGAAAGKRGRGRKTNRRLSSLWRIGELLPGMLAMEVVESMESKNLKDFVYRHIDEKHTIKTDGYSRIPRSMWCLTISRNDQAWRRQWKSFRGHILIGNVKSFIRGIYHGVSHKHLQPYLNEFCYRFNRRFNEFGWLIDS